MSEAEAVQFWTSLDILKPSLPLFVPGQNWGIYNESAANKIQDKKCFAIG